MSEIKVGAKASFLVQRLKDGRSSEPLRVHGKVALVGEGYVAVEYKAEHPEGVTYHLRAFQLPLQPQYGIHIEEQSK